MRGVYCVMVPGLAPHASHILFIDGNYASTSAIASSLYKFGVLFDVLSAAWRWMMIMRVVVMAMVRTFAKETKSDHNLKGSLESGPQFFSCARDTRLEYYLKLRFCWRCLCLHFV